MKFIIGEVMNVAGLQIPYLSCTKSWIYSQQYKYTQNPL